MLEQGAATHLGASLLDDAGLPGELVGLSWDEMLRKLGRGGGDAK
jgi:hypothetical protein